MKTMTFVLAACLSLMDAAWAAGPDLKAISCMFELQAEAYRFLRLEQEILQASSNPVQVGKLKTQIKASAQELFLNVHEARTGLVSTGMQNQYKQLEEIVSDYVSDAISSTDSQDLGALRFKQNALIRLAAESVQLLEQKLSSPATRKLALIGRSKVNVERFAYDFEMCKLHCDQVLAGELADLERSLDEMRNSLAKHFSQHSYELAKNQMIFMRLSVDRRAKSSSMDLAQHNLIVAGGHLWELIDAVLDSYTEAGGE
jgi:uncharacterized membrane-anchored protein YhcB (DUF1043 family)